MHCMLFYKTNITKPKKDKFQDNNGGFFNTFLSLVDVSSKLCSYPCITPEVSIRVKLFCRPKEPKRCLWNIASNSCRTQIVFRSTWYIFQDSSHIRPQSRYFKDQTNPDCVSFFIFYYNGIKQEISKKKTLTVIQVHRY